MGGCASQATITEYCSYCMGFYACRDSTLILDAIVRITITKNGGVNWL